MSVDRGAQTASVPVTLRTISCRSRVEGLTHPRTCSGRRSARKKQRINGKRKAVPARRGHAVLLNTISIAQPSQQKRTSFLRRPRRRVSAPCPSRQDRPRPDASTPGVDAELEAACFADLMLDRGDNEGRLLWLRIRLRSVHDRAASRAETRLPHCPLSK
jgi:hypothetical protein